MHIRTVVVQQECLFHDHVVVGLKQAAEQYKAVQSICAVGFSLANQVRQIKGAENETEKLPRLCTIL